MVYDNNNGGILNPDNFMYYTLSEVYAVKGKTEQFKPVDYPVIINGYEFELPVRSTNASFTTLLAYALETASVAL